MPTADDIRKHVEGHVADGAVKHDEAKPRTDLLPPLALLATAEVFGYGAEKYSDDNWRRGMSHKRLQAAALRHLLQWGSGETIDPESGLPHLAHAACSVLMLLESQELMLGTDDRPSMVEWVERFRRIQDEADLAAQQEVPTVDPYSKYSIGFDPAQVRTQYVGHDGQGPYGPVVDGFGIPVDTIDVDVHDALVDHLIDDVSPAGLQGLRDRIARALTKRD